jgi:hypothetical protein
MNINFSEIDNTQNNFETFNYDNFQTSPEKYWEQKNNNSDQSKTSQIKKKKVSFDDILSNMNLVVNRNGVLQSIVPKQQNEEYRQNEEYQYNEPNYQQQIQVRKTQNSEEPLDRSVKHSYIYNKYFKDYKDANLSKPEVRVPKTIEEYRKMILEDKIKKIEEIRRISQIKSTKLMFTSNSSNVVNPRNINASKNNLRTMNFR